MFPRRQLTSRWLASSLVVAYAAVSAAVGTVLLLAPKEADPQARPAPTYVYEDPPAPSIGSAPSTSPHPSRVAMPAVPEGYQRVAGPGGLITTIPAGWTVKRSSGPGAMQATDPADPNRYVRYGGAAMPAAGLVESHVEYERTYASAHPNFTRQSLGTTTYHGVQALDWEFEHDSPAGRRHAHSMYWRIDGVEYFVYASSTVDSWPETETIYQTMIDNATP
ncbi:hypothetical protein [Actinokineospora enzanensis]|uniref:hypothetical protein n=1 Tax=Actinokineospora enzanensis TaxID=155975 RepID=UPI000378066F|nr:hypothetical protein [Actinokineospora enzanensis]